MPVGAALRGRPLSIQTGLLRTTGGHGGPPLQLREHLSRLANIARGWSDDRFSVDIDLLTFLNRASHIFFAHKLYRFRTISWCWRRFANRWFFRWRRRRIHASSFILDHGWRRWRQR